MENVVYSRVILTPNQTDDGETPVLIQVTEEVNCCVVWATGPHGDLILNHSRPWHKNQMIEYAVNYDVTVDSRIKMLGVRP